MSQTNVVRLNQTSNRRLAELSKKSGKSKQAIVEKALEEYHKKQFFESLDKSFAALQENEENWRDELDERRELESSLSDGLNSNNEWTENANRGGK